MRDTFIGLLWASTLEIQGFVVGAIAIALAFLFWIYSPATQVTLSWVVPVLTVCVLSILVLSNAAYRAFQSRKRELPRVIDVGKYNPEVKDSPIFFLLQPSDLFTRGNQVSIYHKDDKLERLIGLGSVLNIQEGGEVQVVATRTFEGYEPLMGDIGRKGSFDLTRIKIDPFVPERYLTPSLKFQSEEAGQESSVLTETGGEVKALAPEAEAEKSKTDPSSKGGSERSFVLDTIRAFHSRDLVQAKEIHDEMQKTEPDRAIRQKNEAFYLWMLYDAGDSSALAQLEALTQDPSGAAEAHFWLGACFNGSGDFERAAKEYEIAAQGYESETSRASALTSMADSLFTAGKKQEAVEGLIRQIGSITEPHALSDTYQGLASVYKKAGELELQAVALEKAIEVKPNDAGLRFDIAHAYGQSEFHNLSLLHYRYLLRFSPDHASALNNIGVAYADLQMPFRSVRSYKKSFELGETLAGSNIGYKFLEAGFVEDAQDVLNQAADKPKAHPNVASAIASISSREEVESKAADVAMEKGRVHQRFVMTFANAYFLGQPQSLSFAGVWRSPDGYDVTITQENNLVEAHWTKLWNHKFNGILSNSAARIVTYREESSSSKALTETGTGFVYLTPDGKRLEIMVLEKVWGHKEYQFRTWERVAHQDLGEVDGQALE